MKKFTCPEGVSRRVSIDVAERLIQALQDDNPEVKIEPTLKQWGLIVTNICLLNDSLQEFDNGWSDELITAIAEADEAFLAKASTISEHLPFHERYHYQLLDKHLTAVISDALDRKKAAEAETTE